MQPYRYPGLSIRTFRDGPKAQVTLADSDKSTTIRHCTQTVNLKHGCFNQSKRLRNLSQAKKERNLHPLCCKIFDFPLECYISKMVGSSQQLINIPGSP